MNRPPKQLGFARGGFVILYQSGRAEALYTEGHWLLRIPYVEENLHVQQGARPSWGAQQHVPHSPMSPLKFVVHCECKKP